MVERLLLNFSPFHSASFLLKWLENEEKTNVHTYMLFPAFPTAIWTVLLRDGGGRAQGAGCGARANTCVKWAAILVRALPLCRLNFRLLHAAD